MSEGFFAFSNKLLTPCATNTSASCHPGKRNIKERKRGILRFPKQANNPLRHQHFRFAPSLKAQHLRA